MFDQFTLMGLIFMLVIGPAVGNYACSVVYRLPRGKTPFERHPFCGHCNADLKPKDLFPILSWLSTKGKCRYCRGAIPGIYTIIEIACLLLFVSYFIAFGVSETFLLLTAFGVFAIILAAIEWQQGWISSSIYGYAITFAALNSTLRDDTIYGWVQHGFIALVLALVVARVEAALKRRKFSPFESNWIWWLALLAVAAPLPTKFLPFLVLLAAPIGLRYTRLAAPCFAVLAILLPLFNSF